MNKQTYDKMNTEIEREIVRARARVKALWKHGISMFAIKHILILHSHVKLGLKVEWYIRMLNVEPNSTLANCLFCTESYVHIRK